MPRKPPPFDATPYAELINLAARAFLTDTHYAIDIAKAAGKIKNRMANKI